MADNSNNNTNLNNILETSLNETESFNYFDMTNPEGITILEAPDNTSESPYSTETTTPDPLNVAFMNESNVSEQQSQPKSNQQQSQTTIIASGTIHGLIDTIIGDEKSKSSDLNSYRTPKKISIGTMPKTPAMKTTGTMYTTPGIKSSGTMPMTPVGMKSIGTMPMTPVGMKSMGTMPKTPTMTSTSTMPKTPSPNNEIIDLCSPDIPANTSGPK